MDAGAARLSRRAGASAIASSRRSSTAPTSPASSPAASGSSRREPGEGAGSLRRTIFWLAVSAVSLYLVAPSVIAALGSWRQIERLSPAWLAAMAALQAAALACLWALQLLSLHDARWQPVIASQLAGNALAKIAPGRRGDGRGAPVPHARRGRAAARPAVVSGLTAANLLLFGVVLALPVLAIPAILRGGVQRDLLNAAVAGLACSCVLFAAGVVLLSSDRPLLWVGRQIQRVRNRLRRRAEPLQHLPQRLVGERDRIVGTLGPRWKRALAAALGRWGFDFGCLLAALRALDALPRPGLVLLAFCAAQVLAQIPLTPGGLGFVEAGLTRDAHARGRAGGRRGRRDVRLPAVLLLAPASARPGGPGAAARAGGVGAARAGGPRPEITRPG